MPGTLANLYREAYEGLNYRLRTLGGGRWANRCRPTSIVFLLTERCNARCLHCDIWKNKGGEDSPTAEQWKSVVRDLRQWLGPVQVTFSGGEALLKPFTSDLVTYGSSLGLFMEVLTHGYWIDQKRIEQLALARPWRITMSLDGIGATHNKVRGREDFFEKSNTSLETLRRIRSEQRMPYAIRLKTVIMQHNLDDICDMAQFAADRGFEIFYQPIEQNYNTAEDPRWFEHSENWPKDTQRVVAVVQRLIELKRQGLPITNSYEQLETMIPYFQDPDRSRISVQLHEAHERRAICAALTTLQFQSNGDVTVCTGLKPVGNVKNTGIREIWESRPRVWEEGCCLEWRCSPAEKDALAVSGS